jgi:hypothetical protein
MLMSIITAPPEAPQVSVPPPQPRPAPQLDDIDKEIISLVREHGRVKIWTLLDRVAENKGAQSRVEARNYRQRLWQYWVKRLMWLKLIFPVSRNELVAVKPDTRPAGRRPRRQGRTVSKSLASAPVSAGNPADQLSTPSLNYPVPAKRVESTTTPAFENAYAKNTETAPDPAQVTEAAHRLACLPRFPKRQWSGIVGSVRCFRNMLIQLPDDRVVYALGAKRGRVMFTSQPDGPIGSVDGLRRDWGVVPAHLVEVVKDPAAMLLGSLKRGVRERKSEAKASAARSNGAKPCKPGRKRGRPRQIAG